ncbi:hypothetical protein [uncultured Williamsia sp.]|uniref:hypothetical protein n=1 Tax=uncultured Williamsia sp. TaxID=259311 RepID=UPI002602E897|nr:hypothetical protein [uncultured Williamsia sp.]
MAAPVDTITVRSIETAPTQGDPQLESFVRVDSPVHYRLRPTTPGRLVGATWDRSHNPPRATSGHAVLDFPVSDAVVAVEGLYAVTDGMRSAIEAAGLTGVEFGPLAVTRNPHMLDMRELPRLHTLVLTGRACRDDIAPWRCESLALSLRAARTLWGIDAGLLPRTTVLDVIGLPD